MTADPMAEQIRSWDLLAAVAVSGAGHLVHNLAEFPPMALLGPETLAPIGITGLLTWAMVRRRSQVAYLAAAAWAAMVIVVGGGFRPPARHLAVRPGADDVPLPCSRRIRGNPAPAALGGRSLAAP